MTEDGLFGAPADLPMRFTDADLVACLDRELRLREHVYPRWVAGGKMQQVKADAEIARMRAARDRLADLAGVDRPTDGGGDA